jgi:hypothetical protein
MAYQITNAGVSIKFVRSGEFFVAKNSIAEIAVIRQDIIKIGRQDCFSSFFIKFKEVSEPVTGSASELADLLNSWLTPEEVPPQL